MSSQCSWGSENVVAPYPPIDRAAPCAPAHLRRWNITHACDSAEFVMTLAEAQAEIGMRPAMLTPSGWFDKSGLAEPLVPVSLIHAWRGVRQWRSLYDQEGVGVPGEILHAHCFSAAMAGVRAGLPVVYDFSAPVGAASSGPWLTRSLRVAETFVLTRAAAVVVHTQPMWNFAIAQGVRAEDLFLVPEPVAVPLGDRKDAEWLVQLAGTIPGVTLFAQSGTELELLLRAVALLAEEVEDVHLLVESADPALVERHASSLENGRRIYPVSLADRRRALSCTNIVIAGAIADSPNKLAIEALAHGRALLAADTAANREVSPHGRGCLWYSARSERDLAFRAAFLARNPGFRDSLGASGRAHIQATRGPVVVARRYDEVYRHAIDRQRDGRDILHRVPALALCC